MSGSTQVVVTPSGQSFGTSNGGQPKASRVYPFSLNLIAGTQSIVDLRTQQNLKNVQDIQGIYIDNSANATACQVTTPSGQIITCPPNGQGQSPAYVSPLNPTFTFIGSGTVNIVLNNFPTPANFWSTNGASFPMSGGKVLVTDPILDTLVQNNAFNAAEALFGPNDVIQRKRAGQAYYHSFSAAGTATIITGAPNVFITGINILMLTPVASGGDVVFVYFSSTPTNYIVSYANNSNQQPNYIQVTGLQLIGNPAGDNLVVSVNTMTSAGIDVTVFGGPTNII